MIVNHKKPCVNFYDKVFLYPGMNELNAQQAAELTAHPQFKIHCDAGIHEVIGANAKPVAAPKGAVKVQQASNLTLSGMNVDAAVKVINGIMNKTELLRLKTTDVRKGVQDALDAQIKKVTGDFAPKEELVAASEEVAG
jgi:hypothetical protein